MKERKTAARHARTVLKLEAQKRTQLQMIGEEEKNLVFKILRVELQNPVAYTA